MRKHLKTTLHLLCQLLVLPLFALCKLEQLYLPQGCEHCFNFCAQLLAVMPGLPGAFLRRAFYSLTLEYCSSDVHIGFGAIISHRATRIDRHVYIGNYALIGSAHLCEYCLIGSRASILSGKALHVLGDDGLWTPYSPDRLEKVTIGKNVWIGEGAIIVTDVGENAMIGAGSVATTPIKNDIIVAGNPARFVKHLPRPNQDNAQSSEKPATAKDATHA